MRGKKSFGNQQSQSNLIPSLFYMYYIDFHDLNTEEELVVECCSLFVNSAKICRKELDGGSFSKLQTHDLFVKKISKFVPNIVSLVFLSIERERALVF